MDAAIPFQVGGMYLTVNVETEVHALVEQVKQSKTRNAQYSSSWQVCVWGGAWVTARRSD